MFFLLRMSMRRSRLSVKPNIGGPKGRTPAAKQNKDDTKSEAEKQSRDQTEAQGEMFFYLET